MALVGKVVLLTGQAIVVDATGAQNPLALGDNIEPGDTIVAPKGTLVELELANGSRVQIASQQTVTFTQELSDAILYDLIDPNDNAVTQQSINTIIQAIQSGDSIDDIIQSLANARQAAGSDIIHEGHSFVDLLRLNDVLDQFDYNYDVASRDFGDNDPLEQDREVQNADGIGGVVRVARVDEDLNQFNFSYKTGRNPFESRSNNEIDHRFDSEYITPTTPPATTPTPPVTPPVTTPFTVLVTPKGDGNKTAAEATSAAGVMTVKSEAGNTSVITFVGTNGTVTKTIVNDGTNKPVVLSAADLATLGNGPVEVTTVTTSTTGAVITTPDIADGDFNLDTIAPVAPSAGLTHDAANDTGASQTDNITKNASPAISGTGTPGDTITLYAPNGTTVLGTTIVSTGGTWSINPAANYLAEGANALIVKATDPAGNQSPGTVVNVTLDTTAPAAPTGVLPTDGANDTGVSSTDNITKNQTPTLTGTTEAGTTITVIINGTTYTNVTVVGTTWSLPLTTALPSGTYTPTIVATDTAGNSTAAAGETFTVDVTPPIAPTGVLPTDSTNDTGTSSTDNLTKNPTPTLTGTTEAGSTVTVVVNGVPYNATVTGTTWSVPVVTALPVGTYTPTITATDAAGNSTTALGETFTVDTLAPTFAPSVTIVRDTNDDGIINNTEKSGATTTNVAIGIPAGAANGDVIVVKNGATVLATYVVGVAGVTAGSTQTITGVTLPAEGATLKIDASIQDAAGNLGPTVSDSAKIITTNLAVSIVEDTNDNGYINAVELGGSPILNVRVSLPIAAVAGDKVVVSDGVNPPVTITLLAAHISAGSVNATFPTPATGSTFNVSAVLQDSAGSPLGAPVTDSAIIDTIAPTAPTGVLPADAINDTGTSSIDNLTKNQNPTLTGTTEAGTTVTVTVNGVPYNATVTGATWSAPVTTTLPDGTYTPTITATDAAGNTTTSSGETFTVDHTPPNNTTTTITVNTITADNILNAAESTAPVTVTGTVTGEFKAGDTVTLVVNGNTYTTTINAAGVFSVPISGADLLADTSINASVAATDAAGNVGSATSIHTHLVDVTAPTPPTGVLPTDSTNDTGTSSTDNLTKNQNPTLTGTTEAGTTVTVTVNGVTYNATVTGTTWSVPVATLLPGGTYTPTITATDAAGNSTTAIGETFTVDITPPSSATTSITVNPVTADNIVSTTEAAAPTINVTGAVAGEFKAGDVVTLLVNGNPYTGAVNAVGVFTIPVSSTDLKADTTIDASVVATDPAGNTGTITTTHTHNLDVNPPVAVADVATLTEDTANVTGDVTPGTVGQDSDPDASSVITVTGVAAGLVPVTGNVGASVAGTYGSVNIAADGSYTYTPGAAAQALTAGQNVTDTFTYTISDGFGGTASTTLTVTVQGLNDTPTITGPLTGTVTEDGTTVSAGTLNVVDPDAGQSNFVAQTNTAGTYGTFSIDSTGAWTYNLTNAATNVQALGVGAAPTESFVVASADGTTRTIVVTVNGVNDAPVAVADVASTAINTTANIDVLANDTDVDTGDTLSVTKINGINISVGNPVTISGIGTVSIRANGTLDFAPQSGVTGPQNINYTVSDNHGATSIGTLTVNIGANTPPTGTDFTAPAILEDNSYTIAQTDFGFSDADLGQTLGAVKINTVPALGVLTLVGVGPVSAGDVISVSDINAGRLIYTPAQDGNGTNYASFTFSVQDNFGAFDAVPNTFTFVVTAVNDAPTNNVPGAQTILEDGGLSFSGANGNAITVADIDSPSLTTTVSISNGSLTALAFAGATITNNGTGSVTITGSAAAINGALNGLIFNQVADYFGTATLTVNTSDGVAAPVNGTVTFLANGTLTYTPNANYNGSDSFTYTVTSGGVTETATVTVNVTAVNDAPVANAVTANANEDTAPITVTLAGTDVDGTVASFTLSGLPANGLLYTNAAMTTLAAAGTAYTATSNALSLYFKPNADWNGSTNFNYTATDNNSAASTAATATINVTAVADIVADSIVTGKNTAIVFNPITGTNGASADNFEGATPQITQINGTAITAGGAAVAVTNGSVTLAAGNVLTFTPTAGFTGIVPAFSYTVASGGVNEAANINVTVRPDITIDDVSVNESAGTATFTVTLSAASSQTVTVNYSTADGTAIAGSDYTSATGVVVTFTPGQTTQTITVPINNDLTDEPDETFFVNLSGAANAVIADSQGVGTIVDNDAVPTITVGAANAIEGTNIVHTVTLSNPSSVATTYAFSLGGGTATSGADYTTAVTFTNGVTLSGGTLTVPAGVTSFTVTVPTINDTIEEGANTVAAGETYNLIIGGSTGVGTIVDDEVPPTLSVSNVIVSENATSFAVFSVTLSAANSTATTVSLALAGSAAGPSALAATSAADFTNATQVSLDGGATWSANVTSATFAAGTTSLLVRVAILENAPTTEANEDFSLLATTTAGTTANVSATGFATIVERDITAVTSPTITEGGNLDFVVTIPASTGSTVYNVNVTGGTATGGGTDYGTPTITGITGGGTVTLVGNVLTVSATVTGFTIRYATTNDTLNETNETLILNVGGKIATGTITDNDAQPSLAINDVTVNEAAGTMTFTVTLSAASGQTVTVGYGMINQSALSGNDYTANSGTLTFAPGTTTQTITVPILDDTVYEGTETFAVNLSGATYATISDTQGIGTIKDDGTGAGGTNNDTPTLAVSSLTVSDQAAGFATFVVSLSNASATATSMSLALGGGTATGGGTDYGSATATNIQVSTDNGATWANATAATIAANTTFILVRTPITQDFITETSETFTLTATRTAGATLNVSAVGTATITDVNNAPDAINDVPVSNLQEDTANTVVAGNAILGGSGNVADADPNNDTLSITGLVSGTGAVTGATTISSPVTVSGIYGTLQIAANGSYTYTLDNSRIQTQNLIGGQSYNDVFTYRITDGNGGYDTATITVAVTGTLDLTAITPVPVAVNADGLIGEYYGYNDAGGGTRLHADDNTATTIPYPTDTNINSIEDLEKIINGRNVTMGGPNNIVGGSQSGAVNAADVVFNARALNYGQSTNLPNANPSQAAGAALGASSVLANFLKTDAATAVVQTGTPTGATVGTQTGFSSTSDALIRLSGTAYFERGNYDFRVTADDGFRLKVGGETLIEYDGNQGPTTRVFNNVEVSDLISGFTTVEMLYWDQGGVSQLQFEFKLASSGTWVSFSLDNIAFFSAANAPTITDTRIQDIVEDSVINQQYYLRTGSVLDGDGFNNTLTGDAGRDYIQGFAGNDILNSGGSADYLDGGDGNDTLVAGDGNDILIGGAGNDTMTGGLGDDIYRIDSALDVTIENANEGTDTIEIDAAYNPGTYTLAVNFENVLLNGSLNTNVTGNAVNNRITGNDGANVLNGAAGNDQLTGGAGNDTLTGGTGTDIFEWNLADKGARNATGSLAAQDVVTDFDMTAYNNVTAISGGDVIDLRDLLVGEASAVGSIGNLANFIDITQSGANTVMRISYDGGFASGAYDVTKVDQVITFNGINMFTFYGGTAGTQAGENAVLQGLINNNKLFVD